MSFFQKFYSKTPKIKNTNGEVPPNSIASLEKVKIGGIEQCILIRGHDVNNPILLFLHGGPGGSAMLFAYMSERYAEEFFTIVHWDQRGAGKSYSKKIPKETLNPDQYISDTRELILILEERFNKEKIYLIGHSWGSILGVWVAQKYPKLLHAYIGMGQVVNMREGEKISYRYTLEAAKKAGNKKVVKKLEMLKPPYIGDFKGLTFQRKWLAKYGGASNDKRTIQSTILMGFMNSPEYSLLDLYSFIKGLNTTMKEMWGKLCEIDLLSQVPELKVPVYFLAAKADYQVPCELAEKYLEKLKAPHKKMIWFDNSGHSPNLEEPEAYQNALRSILQEIKEE